MQICEVEKKKRFLFAKKITRFASVFFKLKYWKINLKLQFIY